MNSNWVKEQHSKANEVHLGRLDIGRRSTETMKSWAEMDLLNARETVRDLALRIEESNSRRSARKREIVELKSADMGLVALEESNDGKYLEVLRELDVVKQDLIKLKLNVASLLEAKARVDKEAKALDSISRSCPSSIESLKKEIENTNEEQIIVELARLEAVKEFKEIEAQKEAEFAQFSVKMEKMKKRIVELMLECKSAKDLEKQLASTTSDVDDVQRELKLIKASEKHLESNSDFSPNQMSRSGKEESGTTQTLLQSAITELESTKKELSSIEEEGFQCMSAMDEVRDRLRLVYEEMGQLEKAEQKADSTIETLNSKLHREKSRLESATMASNKAKAIASNLSAALQQLQTENESVKKEGELIIKETKTIKAEMEKVDSDIEFSEERLEAALQELEAMKKSEGVALEKLRAITEKAKTARASMYLHSSTITVSQFEYEYLSRCANIAEEIADKKVAAAQAWIEALRAGEREILMKIEVCQREAEEMRLVEEQEKQKTEKPLKVKREVQREPRKMEKQREASELQIVLAPQKRSVKENYITASRRRSARINRVNLPGKYAHRSPSISLKRRTRVMHNLVKLFRVRKK
ncbi:Protein PLASTID MOVEMENT IMPAIRED 15 [Acorus gramineus]|uniref:Protein PLASTID MOVEMENT IMPAIRED 15 n=1 Tax=Acorus gramineus TaxID=55184 RepID=A0AAV9AW85_ACOGR|nr:Protein PLASTID MOVEMENT IMPAIRED 15 [Acorus gramineus]